MDNKYAEDVAELKLCIQLLHSFLSARNIPSDLESDLLELLEQYEEYLRVALERGE